MEDVIYGTSSRRAVGLRGGLADGGQYRSQAGTSTPTTSRSPAGITRSGESEYLLNGAAVRLKDVQMLFMDTGLGRDGYSIISQGKIGDIVASRSEDRREFFEEAARHFQIPLPQKRG